jgi:ABC-2 type transport system ATP-binding protein
MEDTFRHCITDEMKNGRTVLLSSHILAEVEALCDRVSIIRAGQIVESGSLTELRHLTRTSIEVEVANPPTSAADLGGAHNVTIEGTRIVCEVDAQHLDDVVRRLATYGLRSLVAHPPTLEELFLRHYRSGGDGEETSGT